MSELFIEIILLGVIFSLAFNALLVFVILYLKVKGEKNFNDIVHTFVASCDDIAALDQSEIAISSNMVEHWIRCVLLRRKMSAVSKMEAYECLPRIIRIAIATN